MSETAAGLKPLPLEKRLAGVWRGLVGKTPALTPLSASGSSPRTADISNMPVATLPFSPDEIKCARANGRIVIAVPLQENEAIFGLGLQFMKVNHRGRTRYLRVNSDPKQDTGETHAPVPFYVSSRGYGLLLNTARIPTFYCGSAVRRNPAHPAETKDRSRDTGWMATPASNAVEMVVPGDSAEVFVFGGPTMLDAVCRFNLFCGGGVLPPRWGLGFWHRVNAKFTDQEALEEAGEFRKRGFPCDVIGLEPGWQTKSYPCTFEWAPDRFPTPGKFLQSMKADGFRVNLWEHPYVSPAAPLYRDLEPLSGSHSVWGGLAPDLTLSHVRDAYKRQHESAHVSLGVSGYKLDECDGSELTGNSWMFPAHATFPSGHDGEELRQVYGLYLQRLTKELFQKHDRRTYGLVRASNAGAASMPYVLYSDLYDHRQFVRALCNSGFSGLLWTPEARTARSPEEWVRRMQVVCLSPMALLNAWSSSTKPWSYEAVAGIVKSYMELRMRLMPYLYSAFARYYLEGKPPVRALALETNGLPETGEIDDQYMLGDSVMVAPVFAGQTARDVYFPPGDWYDFDTGERHAGGRSENIPAVLERLPLFVRDGGVIPMMPALAHAPASGDAVPLEVRHYGKAPGSFRLFDDDGETYAYERGEFHWRRLDAVPLPDGSLMGTQSPPQGASAYGDITWRFMSGSAGGGTGLH